ncbi:MAG: HepT-like ribonuclease domain-containing protein [Alkalispirochaeta sp.]
MPKSHDVYLNHISDEIRFLQSLPKFSDGPALKNDAVQSRAVVRSLEIIGEAASKIDPGFRSKHAEIEWRRIIALRNRLIHDYMGINYNIVVDVLQNEVPQLAKQIEGLLRDDTPTKSTKE